MSLVRFLIQVFAAFLLLCNAATAQDSATPLRKGVPLTNLSGPLWEWAFYEITVPAGATNLTFTTSGGSGDVNTCFDYEQWPTEDTYIACSSRPGNNETLTLANPSAGTYYLQTKAYQAYSGMSVVASYTPPPETPLERGVTLTGLSGPQWEYTIYTMVVPDGADSLTFTTSGGTGDVNLYLDYGKWPTPDSYLVSSAAAGTNNETVTIETPSAGTYYLLAKSYAAYDGMSLRGTYNPPTRTLTKDVALTNLSGPQWEYATFEMTVPAGATNLKLTTSGGTGNVDLYVNYGSPAMPDRYVASSATAGNNESVTIAAPSAGTYYILTKALTDYSGMSLVATYQQSAIVLKNGETKANLSGAQNSQVMYQITVPAGATSLSFTTSGGSGDVNIYAQNGTPATTSSSLKSVGSANAETITISPPQAGTYFLLLNGNTAYSGVSLIAQYMLPSTALTNGTSLTPLGAPSPAQKMYHLSVPANATSLTFNTSAAGGNNDLYVARNTQPTVYSYLTKSDTAGSSESITIAPPTGGTYYLLFDSKAAFSDGTLVARYLLPSTPIANGATVGNLGGAQGAESMYQITVPANATKVTFTTSGGTGDVNLYALAGSQPTVGSYSSKSDSNSTGPQESISITSPAANTYYLLIKGNTAYSGVSLTAKYDLQPISLTKDQAAQVPAGQQGTETMYQFVVPAGQTNITFRTSGGTGDVGIYGQLGSQPTAASYQWRSDVAGNSETMSIDSTVAGTYYLLVKGNSAYAGVSVVATYSAATNSPQPLVNASPYLLEALAAGADKMFSINVPAGQSNLTFTTSGGTGNVNIYAQFGAQPTTASTPKSDGPDNAERISIAAPAAGTHYLLVHSVAASANVAVLAEFSTQQQPLPVTPLQSGVELTNLSGAQGSPRMFSLVVPQGIRVNNMSFTLSGGTGNANIYMQRGRQATTADYSLASTNVDNTETITKASPDAAVYYLLVDTPTTYSGATLLATWTTTDFKIGIHAHRLDGDGEAWDDCLSASGDPIACSGDPSTDIPNPAGRKSPAPLYTYSFIRDWSIDGVADAVHWKGPGEVVYPDDIYQSNATRGAKVLKTFAMTPSWASKSPNQCNHIFNSYLGGLSGPASRDQYKQYVKGFVQHMYEKNWLWAVEGWNEPYPYDYVGKPAGWVRYIDPVNPENSDRPPGPGQTEDDMWPCSRDANTRELQFTTMTMTQLADSQKAIWEATKEVDPTILVISPANAYAPGIEKILRATTSEGEPITKFFDVLAWHAYNRRPPDATPFQDNLENFATEVDAIKGYILQAKKDGIPISADIPLLDSEHGWESWKEGGPWFHNELTAAERAKLLSDTAAWAKQRGLLGIFWFAHDDDMIGSPWLETATNKPISDALQDMDNKYNKNMP